MVRMKTKFLILSCVLAISLVNVTPAFASEDSASLEVVADVVIIRPACLAATVIGSALFVVSLPIAAISKSVKKTAHVLVVRPAQATFTRQIGDMGSLVD